MWHILVVRCSSQIGPLTTKYIGIALRVLVWWAKLKTCRGGFHMHQAHIGQNEREEETITSQQHVITAGFYDILG